MAIAYLSLGANLGNKKNQLVMAVAKLAERAGNILALSSIYETEPWGFDSSNTFFNVALQLETLLSPLELLNCAQLIEAELGRVRNVTEEYQDRLIDIDLLLYDEVVMDTPVLTLPHPLMHKRLFVLEPLAEIAPNLVIPATFCSVSVLFNEISKIDRTS